MRLLCEARSRCRSIVASLSMNTLNRLVRQRWLHQRLLSQNGSPQAHKPAGACAGRSSLRRCPAGASMCFRRLGAFHLEQHHTSPGRE
jgi:hypothetical protein